MEDNKVELTKEQKEMLVGISKELKIPEQEVLWVITELGVMMALLSMGNPKVYDVINKAGENIPEYKNWKPIVKSIERMFNDGQKMLKGIENKDKN